MGGGGAGGESGGPSVQTLVVKREDRAGVVFGLEALHADVKEQRATTYYAPRHLTSCSVSSVHPDRSSLVLIPKTAGLGSRVLMSPCAVCCCCRVHPSLILLCVVWRRCECLEACTLLVINTGRKSLALDAKGAGRLASAVFTDVAHAALQVGSRGQK